MVFISRKDMKAIEVIEDNLVISENFQYLNSKDDEVLIKVKAAGT